jgi:hypothetical protein
MRVVEITNGGGGLSDRGKEPHDRMPALFFPLPEISILCITWRCCLRVVWEGVQ